MRARREAGERAGSPAGATRAARPLARPAHGGRGDSRFGGVVVVLETQRPVGGESSPTTGSSPRDTRLSEQIREAEVEPLERLPVLQHKARKRKKKTQLYFRSNLFFNSVVSIKFTVIPVHWLYE